MRLGALISLLFTVGCAHLPKPAEALVSVQNASGHDVCAVHLWSDDDELRSVENRLLPGAQLLEPSSTFRLHDGSRRDFTVPAATYLRIEAVDCSGQLVDSREVSARPGSVVALALVEPGRG